MSSVLRVAEEITTETMPPDELRDAARRLLADKLDRRAALRGTPGPGGALLGAMSEQGWFLLTAPAVCGGLGQDFGALAPIYEELGRALSPVTIAGTMAAVDVLALAGGTGCGALVDRIVEGSARVAAAFAGTGDAVEPGARFTTVEGALDATHLLILPAGEPASAFIAELAAENVTAVGTWDLSRSFGDVTLSGAVPLEVGDGCVARAHLDLAMAWDCIGGARQALDEAIAYMGTRRQFGRPVGSFQALKHRAADLRVGLEIANALTTEAGAAYAARREGWSDLAGQARLLAVDAYRAVAEECVQFHGGIGFTWEHDCHLFLKRALMNEMLGGSPETVRDRIAPGIISRALARD